MGDTINVFLAQQRLTAADFLAGKGVREAAERFKADNILAVHFKRVQGKPFMDVRFFAAPRADPAITHVVLRAPRRPCGPPTRAPGSPRAAPRTRPRPSSARSWQRLLGGDLEAGSYSTGENSLPLREVAKFKFPVLAMDLAVAPKDKIPRMVVSDGDQIYMYRIVDQKIEPEWTTSVRSLGRVFSLQLADLDGDGILEVIGNRYAPQVGLNCLRPRLAKDGKPYAAGRGRRRTSSSRSTSRARASSRRCGPSGSAGELLHAGSGRPGDPQERQARRREGRARARGLPADGRRLLQCDGQGHPVARLHRRIQPAADRRTRARSCGAPPPRWAAAT